MWKYQKEIKNERTVETQNTQTDVTTNQNVSVVNVTDWKSFILNSDYTPISKNPEVTTAINLIAGLIASTSIHLYENTNNGNKRLNNDLSRLVDIEPNNFQTRFVFISSIVRALLLEGDGNVVIYPETKNGKIQNIYLLNPGNVSFRQDGFGYYISYCGKRYEPNDMCHIAINPHPEYPWKGTGYRVPLRKVVDCLEQANTTKQAFLKSEWMPTIVFSIDGAGLISPNNEATNPGGKDLIMNQYIKSKKRGEPWLLPEGFKIETVKPLSLNDLAINPMITLDKKTVASLLNIPSFLLGVGDFKQQEWNNFISTKIKIICIAIEQALTKSLLVNPKWFFKFNFRSLYSYDIGVLSQVAAQQKQYGVINGNEARDLLGFSPVEGLDEYTTLENYIPVNQLSKQKKLIQEDAPENEDSA